MDENDELEARNKELADKVRQLEFDLRAANLAGPDDSELRERLEDARKHRQKFSDKVHELEAELSSEKKKVAELQEQLNSNCNSGVEITEQKLIELNAKVSYYRGVVAKLQDGQPLSQKNSEKSQTKPFDYEEGSKKKKVQQTLSPYKEKNKKTVRFEESED